MLDYNKKIKEFAVKLRESGKGYNDIAKEINKKFNEKFDYIRAKNICRSPRTKEKEKEKQGEVERKPKVEKTDTGYIIRYGKNQKLVTTTQELEKAFAMFCLAGLTMNSTALAMGWNRAEFFAAKVAFEITKDSIPLLPETIDGLSTDEIAERVRIAKKQYAIQKIHENKARDIEQTNKKLQSLSHYFDIAVEKINAIDSKPFNKAAKAKPQSELHLLAISDVHAGAQINSRFSKYNLDIMRSRFEDIARETIDLLRPCELTILDAGDKISGLLHSSIEKTSVNVIDSLVAVTECYLKLITTLLSAGFSIRFASVAGNHDSTVAAKNARTTSESFSRLFDWTLRLKLSDCANVSFIDSDQDMLLMPFFDYSVLALHGIPRKLSRFARLYPGFEIKEILAGHLHTYSANSEDNLPVYRLNSLCSPDEYAIGLGLSSEPGARLITYGKQGRVCDRLIRFQV